MATFYIAQTALGANNGTTAADARPISWLNDASNWSGGAGTICSTATRDTVEDVVRFVGTISTAFAWPYATGTGAAGIKFAFEPGAKFSAANWPTGAMAWESAAYQKHRVTIDGEGVGIIECVSNGTGLATSVGSVGIYFISANYVTVKNLTIRNLYIRTYGTEEIDGGSGIYASTAGGAFTDFTVEDCVIHDVNIAINAPYTTGSARYTFRRNEAYNINWGIGSGSSNSTATMTAWLGEDNWFHDFECWDEPDGYEAFHHNGIFLFGSNGTNNFTDAIIRRNKFGPNMGTRATSGVYLSSYGMRGSYQVYNNIFFGNTTNGLLTIGTADGSTTYVRNNTFVMNSPTNSAVNVGGSSASTGFTVNLRNNIVTGGSYLSVNYAGTVTVNSDYNLVHGYTQSFPGPVTIGVSSSLGAIPWVSWRGLGNDAHSIIDSDPLLDGYGRPGTGSPALGAGEDLSAHFTNDYDSVTRVAPWDMGAFESAGEVGPSSSTPNPLGNRGTRAFIFAGY